MSWHLWLDHLEDSRGDDRGPFLDWVGEHGSKYALTWDVYSKMRLNSAEREAIIPFMDDDCLKQHVEKLLENCSRISHAGGVAVTYDEAVIHVMVPELLRRLGRGDGSLPAGVDMEMDSIDATMDSSANTAFMSPVRKCRRCGRDHDQLPFVDLENPPPAATHYAICPDSLQPILARVRKRANDNTEPSTLQPLPYGPQAG